MAHARRADATTRSSRFCAEEPVERVFLEDVARRGLGRFAGVARGRRLTALCHVGANVVPSGRGCGAFADAPPRVEARMLIGEEGAVRELWDELRGRAARGRARTGRASRSSRSRSRREPARPGCARRRSRTSTLLVPACAAAHELELGVDPLGATPTGSAGARARRSRRGARGSGRRTA